MVAATAAAEARRGKEGASITIVDDGGNLMYLERIQPTFPMGATISTEKARTAAGKIVGAIGVSGASSARDAVIAQAGAGALGAKTSATK